MSQRYKLPNGLLVYHVNKYETDFVYHEVFVDKIYHRSGIVLNEHAIVFDVGANIGLFTIYVKEKCPSSVVYAFEPSPDLFELLSLNVIQYENGVNVFQYGLSDKEKSAILTFYPNYSILSGFHACYEEESQLLRTCLANQFHLSNPDYKYLPQSFIESLVQKALCPKKECKCQLKTISSVILEQNISVVDLLKIDTEKCELDIIYGIERKDWEKIRQIVIEVHDYQDLKINQIISILNSKGFKTKIKQEHQLFDSKVVNIYAINNF